MMIVILIIVMMVMMMMISAGIFWLQVTVYITAVMECSPTALTQSPCLGSHSRWDQGTFRIVKSEWSRKRGGHGHGGGVVFIVQVQVRVPRPNSPQVLTQKSWPRLKIPKTQFYLLCLNQSLLRLCRSTPASTNSNRYQFIWQAWINSPCKLGLDPIDRLQV